MKDDCLNHELWQPVIQSPDLNAEMKISEAINALKKLLNSDDVTINLMNDKFVYQPYWR